MEGSFFKVGEFEVDPRTNQIYREGTATVLPPRLMDLLCFFASRADEVVTRTLTSQKSCTQPLWSL